MAQDPVCGREVHPKQSQWLRSYHGRTYHFCSGTCASRFIAFPEEFVATDDIRRATLLQAPDRRVVEAAVGADELLLAR